MSKWAKAVRELSDNQSDTTPKLRHTDLSLRSTGFPSRLGRSVPELARMAVWVRCRLAPDALAVGMAWRDLQKALVFGGEFAMMETGEISMLFSRSLGYHCFISSSNCLRRRTDSAC